MAKDKNQAVHKTHNDDYHYNYTHVTKLIVLITFCITYMDTDVRTMAVSDMVRSVSSKDGYESSNEYLENKVDASAVMSYRCIKR